jgi:serine/threonine kinase PknH
MGQAGPDRSRQWVLPTVIGVAAALLLGAIGVVIGLLASRNSGPSSPPSTPYAAPTTTVPMPGPTVYQTVPGPPSAPPIPAPTAAPAPDPEAAAVQQLQQIAASDRPVVAAQLADRWVPQLSSKRPGVVDKGVVWNNAMTLQEHLQLRQRYGARLLWSGDWSTFDAGDYWVTIAGISFPNAAGALNWCSSQGFDPDHCYAKLVSTTHPVPGSTAHN